MIVKHNSRQRYLYALYQLAVDPNVPLDMRYSIVREMCSARTVIKSHTRSYQSVRRLRPKGDSRELVKLLMEIGQVDEANDVMAKVREERL